MNLIRWWGYEHARFLFETVYFMVILFYKNLNRLFYYMVIDVYISFSSYIQLDLSIASKCEGPTFQKPRHIFIEQLQDDSPGDLHKKEFLPCCSNGIKIFHFDYRHLQMAYSSYLCYSCSLNWAELIRGNKPPYNVSVCMYIFIRYYSYRNFAR